MKDKPFEIIAAVVFGLIMLGTFTRLAFQIPVQIGTWAVPAWPSMIGFVLALVLLVWAVRLVRTH